MATTQNGDFKDPNYIVAWLDTALDKEKEKYAKCPVKPDIFPGHEVAQGWGYVVAGYFLVEESFKALLFIREKEVPRKHSLSNLFSLFEMGDKETLCEYYTDYQATIEGRTFPFKTLEDFLTNLDGDLNKRGDDHIGSFVWRYFLIEEQRSDKMPVVSVEFLHEIVFGCVRMIEYAHNGRFKPTQYTRGWRLRRKRKQKYSDWLTVRMNTDGWDDMGDRLEILWGPDYRGRHDLLLFKGGGMRHYFTKVPDDFSLPIIDKRKDIDEFDVEAGLKSIGITRVSSPPGY